MRRRIWIAGLAALPLMAGGTLTAIAQETVPAEPEAVPEIEVEVVPAVPEVVIGGQVVMRIRTGAGGLTPAERAESVRRRLGPILTMPDLEASDIRVHQRLPGQTAAIYVRDRLLITVDRNLAEANGTTPRILAFKWRENLRGVLPEVAVEVRTP